MLRFAPNPLVAAGILVMLGLVGACGRPADAVAGASSQISSSEVSNSEISRDLWYLVPDVDRLTTIWLSAEVRGPTGPPFRFLNVVHQGPGEAFAAFSRPVVDPTCGPIAFSHRQISIEVRALTGDWRTVESREDLAVDVTVP